MSFPDQLDPAYPHDDPTFATTYLTPNSTTSNTNTAAVLNEISPPDFLRYQNIQIPEDNQVSSALFRQQLAKKPLVEAVSMLDCPVPRFWALQPIKIGYLNKQGHHFRNWKRRLAAIEGHYLYYYSDESDRLPKGVLLLDNCIVEEDPAMGKERKAYCFAITSVKSWNIQSMGAYVNRTYYFCVSTAQELNDWMSLVNTLSTGLPRYATEELW